MLSTSDIIQGAYFAVEQAGRLVNDAAILFVRQRWATTLALSVFCLEEIGKAEMLLDRAADADKTGPKTRDEIRNARFTRHTSKLREAREITITASLSWWGNIPEDAAPIAKQLEAALNLHALEAPKEAHQARLQALFVHLLDDEWWSRPAEVTESDAHDWLTKANLEYRRIREQFVNATDPLLKEVKRALGCRLPDLPGPAAIQG
jgi:AbiV family abortive infection protein